MNQPWDIVDEASRKNEIQEQMFKNDSLDKFVQLEYRLTQKLDETLISKRPPKYISLNFKQNGAFDKNK